MNFCRQINFHDDCNDFPPTKLSRKFMAGEGSASVLVVLVSRKIAFYFLLTSIMGGETGKMNLMD